MKIISAASKAVKPQRAAAILRQPIDFGSNQVPENRPSAPTRRTPKRILQDTRKAQWRAPIGGEIGGAGGVSALS